MNNKEKEFSILMDEWFNITNINMPFVKIASLLNQPPIVDLFELDKKLETPDGISMSDYIIEKYGKKAAVILDKLIEFCLELW